MSKLNELAELLKSAKKSTGTIAVEPVPAVQEQAIPEPVSQEPESVVEAVQQPTTVEQKPNLFITQLQKEIQLLKKMIEDTSRRQHAFQPSYGGGGADSTADIVRPIRVVTDDFTPTTRDWYIGVGDRNEIITITLPTAIKNGREYVIKDEAGIAELVPIRIVGVIENDPEGVELRINNGSVTLLYNNGWRII